MAGMVEGESAVLELGRCVFADDDGTGEQIWHSAWSSSGSMYERAQHGVVLEDMAFPSSSGVWWDEIFEGRLWNEVGEKRGDEVE